MQYFSRKVYRFHSFKLLFVLLLLNSCALKQQIFFKSKQSINPSAFESTLQTAQKNYLIAPSDYLAISVYTNKGELLIDPNNEFNLGAGALPQRGGQVNNQQQFQQRENFNSFSNLPLNQNNTDPNSYLVAADGSVKLPMVGTISLEGLTLRAADSVLSSAYSQYYEEPYVFTQYLNKRVILMGALGDQIVPLRNENMNLIEVLAIAGNVQQNAKANKIRVIRGDLNKPDVQLIDLSTIEGLQSAHLKVMPGDIIYVEPRRQLDQQSLSNLNLFSGLISSLLALVILVNGLR